MNRYALFHVLTILLLAMTLPGRAAAVALQEPSAIYTITFQSEWSNETHPHDNFPGNAHFSPLIGATHTLSTTLWLPGELASPGIEQMAETGATNQLRSEIIANGAAIGQMITGSGLSRTPGEVIIPTITINREHPAVTLVTMIAPSPDWFVSVHAFSLLDEAGQWKDQVVMELYPYDAGTDDGVDYSSPNAEPEMHQPISSLQGTTPFSSAPIGTMTFTRQHRGFLPLILHQ